MLHGCCYSKKLNLPPGTLLDFASNAREVYANVRLSPQR